MTTTRRLRQAWAAVYFGNVLLPFVYAAGFALRDVGYTGLACGIGLVWLLGHLIGPRAAETFRTIHGGGLITLTPFAAIAPGYLALAILRRFGHAGIDPTPSGRNLVADEWGGFFATILTAAQMIAFAWVAGRVFGLRVPSASRGAAEHESWKSRGASDRPTPPLPWKRLAAIGVLLVVGCYSLRFDPIFGLGTNYAPGYSEQRFHSLRAGMAESEVEDVMGAPLGKGSFFGQGVVWMYSDQPNPTSNFFRRWVIFEDGEVDLIISDYWWD